MKRRLLNALHASPRSIKESPLTRVILLSRHANEGCLQQAVQEGALGYLLNGAELGEMGLVIKAGAIGERYLTLAVAQSAI